MKCCYVELVRMKLGALNVDDLKDSKFKNLGEIHRQWLPDFLGITKKMSKMKSE